MKSIKTVLVGLGRIGWNYHLPSIVEHDGFELCGVVDTCEERLLEAKNQYGVPGYIQMDEMIENIQPDLVVIASPTHLHKNHALIAMHAGADVFLDKPMAPSFADACAMAQFSKDAHRKLMVFQPHRVVPEIEVLKKIMSSGILGPIHMIKRAVSSYERRNDWQTLKKYGGGMLSNYGAHYIDQMIYLTQTLVKESFCRCHKVATFGDAEDVVKIVLGMENEITVDIDIHCATAFEITPWMVFGKYGTAVYEGDGWEGSFRVKYFDPCSVPDREVNETLAAEGRAYVTDCELPWKIKHFPVLQTEKINFYDKCYETFSGKTEPFVPLDQSLFVMNVIENLKSNSYYHV